MTRSSRERLFSTRTAWLWALFCCALWGSAFPCIKLGYRLFHMAAGDTAAHILFAGCRFALAGLLVIVAGSLLQTRVLLPRRAAWRPVAILASFQTALQYVFFYVGLAHTDGVSKYALCHRHREERGVSAPEWLRRIRIAKAKQ